MPFSFTDDVEPLSYRQVYHVWITSANTNFQLARSPWPTPSNKKLQIEKILVTNMNGGATTVHIWDQDLSNTTTVGRGSGSIGGSLLSVGAGAANSSGVGGTTITIPDNDCPAEYFGAGIAVMSTQINTFVSAEVDIV